MDPDGIRRGRARKLVERGEVALNSGERRQAWESLEQAERELELLWAERELARVRYLLAPLLVEYRHREGLHAIRLGRLGVEALAELDDPGAATAEQNLLALGKSYLASLEQGAEGDPRWHFTRGILLALLDDPAAGRADLVRARDGFADDEEDGIRTTWYLGTAEHALGNRDAARQLERAARARAYRERVRLYPMRLEHERRPAEQIRRTAVLELTDSQAGYPSRRRLGSVLAGILQLDDPGDLLMLANIMTQTCLDDPRGHTVGAGMLIELAYHAGYHGRMPRFLDALRTEIKHAIVAVRATLSDAETPDVQAYDVHAEGLLQWAAGDFQEARSRLKVARELYRDLDHMDGITAVTNSLQELRHARTKARKRLH